jgi:hypothetical protein
MQRIDGSIYYDRLCYSALSTNLMGIFRALYRYTPELKISQTAVSGGWKMHIILRTSNPKPIRCLRRLNESERSVKADYNTHTTA